MGAAMGPRAMDEAAISDNSRFGVAAVRIFLSIRRSFIFSISTSWLKYPPGASPVWRDVNMLGGALMDFAHGRRDFVAKG
jgi:hypothetical protein